MHNVFVNQVRSAAATRTVPLEASAAELPQPQAGDRLEIRDLDTALQSLPEEQLAVLLLVGLEQMSYDEATRVLDVPIGTVMSRLSRGRERAGCCRVCRTAMRRCRSSIERKPGDRKRTAGLC